MIQEVCFIITRLTLNKSIFRIPGFFIYKNQNGLSDFSKPDQASVSEDQIFPHKAVLMTSNRLWLKILTNGIFKCLPINYNT